MQFTVFSNFIKDFQEEEKALACDLSENAMLADKQKDIEKREREEFKRLEKLIFKKDQQEVEEAFANSNAKLLRDRISKTINEGILKQQKVLARVQIQHAGSEADVEKVKLEIQAALSKKTMLNNLSLALLEKNYELFLKHEQMLEEERTERQNLATNFGDKMREVQ